MCQILFNFIPYWKVKSLWSILCMSVFGVLSLNTPLHYSQTTRWKQGNVLSVAHQTSHLCGVFQSRQSVTRAVSGRLRRGVAGGNWSPQTFWNMQLHTSHFQAGGNRFRRLRAPFKCTDYLFYIPTILTSYWPSLCVIRLICLYCIMQFACH